MLVHKAQVKMVAVGGKDQLFSTRWFGFPGNAEMNNPYLTNALHNLLAITSEKAAAKMLGLSEN